MGKEPRRNASGTALWRGPKILCPRLGCKLRGPLISLGHQQLSRTDDTDASDRSERAISRAGGRVKAKAALRLCEAPPWLGPVAGSIGLIAQQITRLAFEHFADRLER